MSSRIETSMTYDSSEYKYSKNSTTSVKEAGVDIGKDLKGGDKTQSDWNESDSTSPGYIKNKFKAKSDGYNESTVIFNELSTGTDDSHAVSTSYGCIVEGRKNSTANYNGVATSYSHMEGAVNWLTGARTSHVEGYGNSIVGCESSHVEGRANSTNADFTHVEGKQNIVTGVNSHAEGCNNQVTGGSAHAEGYNTRAAGNGSHSEGDNGRATGSDSHVEGSGGLASGTSSHAEGNGCEATGYAAHAEGNETHAVNDDSHAEGAWTWASGQLSHAEGSGTVAAGYASHSGGDGGAARGRLSFIHGDHLEVYNDGGVAFGKANAERDATNNPNDYTIFAVGNGTISEGTVTEQANAFEIRSDNTAYVNGQKISTVDISSRKFKENITPLSDEDAKKLLDVEVVNFDYKEGVINEAERYGNKGVIAEQVEDLIPYAIEHDEEALKVDYRKFIPYLIKMIQIQQKEIDELKNK